MVETLLQVFGGLAIFIFDMKLMSDGLHQVAGEKMRSILRMFSANPLVAALSGAVVTCVIQSSSASTVMVIGFVNAGLLSLVQAMGLIFGANIGTTITAQLVAFDISWIIMPSIIIGLFLSFAKQQKISNWSETILGLGFLFLGMELMSSELKVLAQLDSFKQAFLTFQCSPVNGSIPLGSLMGALLIGLVATMVVQSSSACSGIVIALGASGLLDLYTAVVLVLGSNIGTTVTAQLAALTANRVAKQTALAHTLFNVIGVVLIGSTFLIPCGSEPLFFMVIKKFSLNGDLPRQIANAHTVFNVLTTVVLLPFIGIFAKVCERMIPVKSGKIKYQYLEPHLLDAPPIALTQTAYALRRMLQKSWKMVNSTLNFYNRNDEKNQSLLRQIEKRETDIDNRQKNITDYLWQLMERKLNDREAAQIPLLLHCTNDVERIGDHALVIHKIFLGMESDALKFSERAEKEYDNLHDKLAEMASSCAEMLTQSTPELRKKTMEMYSEFTGLITAVESEHVARINNGECKPQVGLVYLRLLSEFRKVARHLRNINERAEVFYDNFKIK
jgi:Na/Pi-cotransporter